MNPFVQRVRWARLLALVLALVSAQLATRLAVRSEAADAALGAAAEACRREALAEGRAEVLQRRTRVLEETLTSLRLRMADDERCSRLPPSMHGSVLTARANVVPAVVLVSIGRRDGLERGDYLTVYRGSRFVAKVLVEAVHEDVALARVLFSAEGEEVRGGDLVASRLE